jgi:aspartyl/asparaginyl beta-hydroxylase (cupin superfamily)
VNAKSIKRFFKAVIPLGLLIYFIPVVTIAYIVLGLVDLSRHKKISAELARKYFMGNGTLTWLLSPVNLLFDIMAPGNKLVYSLADFPDAHREEIQFMLSTFDQKKDQIIAGIHEKMDGKARGMLFYKWYGKNVDTSVPEFNRDFKFIKTIGVSVFNKRQSTSLHFGPLRLTLRILYNLTPRQSEKIFIEVNGKKHFWHENPLFVFDDTLQHRSINEEDWERYCVFADILRPSPFLRLETAIMTVMQFCLQHINGVFYKNWTFLR